MKKLLALAMAAMMCAVAAPIHAAEEATEEKVMAMAIQS